MRYVFDIPVASIPETWQTFSEELLEDMVSSIENLPKVLEQECGNFATFSQLCRRPQLTLLNETLGDGSPLVEAILKCCQSVSANVSHVDMALNYKLAPSTQLNHMEVVDVLNAIIGLKCVDMRDICNYLTTLPSPTTTSASDLTTEMSLSSSPTTTELAKDMTKSFKFHYDNTLYLGEKEASGWGYL